MSEPAFEMRQKVLFKHCDPAGIVFYPRYFEMVNDAVEAFFDRAVGVPFERMHPSHGVPTVAIRAEFRRPSRHGDALALRLWPTRLGATSVDMALEARAGDETRFEARLTLVHVDMRAMRPERWPAPMRLALSARLPRAPHEEGIDAAE